MPKLSPLKRAQMRAQAQAEQAELAQREAEKLALDLALEAEKQAEKQAQVEKNKKRIQTLLDAGFLVFQGATAQEWRKEMNWDREGRFNVSAIRYFKSKGVELSGYDPLPGDYSKLPDDFEFWTRVCIFIAFHCIIVIKNYFK